MNEINKKATFYDKEHKIRKRSKKTSFVTN